MPPCPEGNIRVCPDSLTHQDLVAIMRQWASFLDDSTVALISMWRQLRPDRRASPCHYNYSGVNRLGRWGVSRYTRNRLTYNSNSNIRAILSERAE